MTTEEEVQYLLSPYEYKNIYDLNNGILGLYGYSPIARDIIDHAITDGYGPSDFLIIDKDAKLWGGSYKNVKIISPSDLKEIKNVHIFITAFSHMMDIIFIIEQMNIPLHPIFYCLFEEEFQFNGMVVIKTTTFNTLILSYEGVQLFVLANRYKKLQRLGLDKDSLNVITSLYKIYLNQMMAKPAAHIYTQNEYFQPEVIERLSNTSVFVDVGAYDGDTIRMFLEAVDNNFGAIHAFELDKNNYTKLEAYVADLPIEIKSKISLYNYGLYDTKKEVSYISKNVGTLMQGEFANANGVLGIVDTLDNLLKDKKVDFIKMDIEGAEMAALRGAEGIIKEQKPILAIACYHQMRDGAFVGSMDLFDIPTYIKSLVPEYKIFIRHHTDDRNLYETVCYAIV
jgi:FkbM family methyltransferase